METWGQVAAVFEFRGHNTTITLCLWTVQCERRKPRTRWLTASTNRKAAPGALILNIRPASRPLWKHPRPADRGAVEDGRRGTYGLPDAGVCGSDGGDPAGGRGRRSLVFGLSAPSIARHIRAAAATAGLGSGFSGHSGRVGMAAAGAPTHGIMAQGRWKTARMVEVYTRAEEAGRAAKWLA